MHNVASHDIDFGELSVDYLSTGVSNSWMQSFVCWNWLLLLFKVLAANTMQMSHGLFFIDEVANAGEYDKERELLWGSIGTGTAHLAEALESLAEDVNDNVDDEDFNGLFKHLDPKDGRGPFVVWCELHHGEVVPGYVFLDSTYNLRQAAYVFWDEARVHKKGGQLQRRFQYMAIHDEFWGPQPTEADLKKMIESFNVRSKLHSNGCHGYYSG